jgi:aminopeptidase N
MSIMRWRISGSAMPFRWLNEGFASYAEYLTEEAMFGASKAQPMLAAWERAILRSQNGAPLIRPPYEDMFGANTYLKGGYVLHMLREQIGDEAFFKTLKTYVQRFSNKNARTADFEAVTVEVSGKDLSGFFDQWLRRADLPDISITWSQQGETVQTLICQRSGKPFALALPVSLAPVAQQTPEAQTVQGVKTETLSLNAREERTQFKPGFSVGSWNIDSAQTVLASVRVSKVKALPAHCGQ